VLTECFENQTIWGGKYEERGGSCFGERRRRSKMTGKSNYICSIRVDKAMNAVGGWRLAVLGEEK
jgi:hypothetical protein